MTFYLGKGCSFDLFCLSFVNVHQFAYAFLSIFGFEGEVLDLIEFRPNHCFFFLLYSFCYLTTESFVKEWTCKIVTYIFC